jgi:hypothetical protein
MGNRYGDMMNIQPPDRKLLMVYADDWSLDDGPTDLNHAFKLYQAWVVGFLIRETDEAITLGPEIFDDRVRHTQTIPKTAIRERIEIPLPTEAKG